SVVSVVTKNRDGAEIGQGSGFYIGKGLFITNYHVIEDGTYFKIITNQNVELDVAGIVKQDKVRDLAILKTKSLPDLKPLKIGSKDMVAKGDAIVTIGNPEGLQNTVSEGIVSGFRQVGSIDYIQITAPITYGSSGGPLFNIKGYVIGVNTAGIESGNLNFAVAIDNIKDWLSELEPKAFNDIAAIDVAKQKEAENKATNNEARVFIENMFKAWNSEDANAIKALYYEARYGENAASQMQWQFDTYNLKYTLESMDVTAYQNSTADVVVTYTIKKLNGPVFRDVRMTGKYDVWEIKGKWYIMNSTSDVKEYLDIPASQTSTIGQPPATQAQSGTTGSTSAKIEAGSEISDLTVTDVIMHPTKSLLYITDKSQKKLYEYNFDTNKYIRQISFGLDPESIEFANNEIYVGLLKKEHNSQVYDESQAGAIAIIDPATFAVTQQMDINLDPYDIVVDKDGYIYVTSGSGQHTQLKSYSRKTKQEVDSARIYQKSYAQLNPVMNRIYTITNGLSPRDMWAFNISSGKFAKTGFQGGYDSPYHGDYAMKPYFKISPDGQYIFNGAGTIFACGGTQDTDMNYVSKLGKEFLDIAFNEKDGLFYTSIEGKFIYVYDYKTFEGVNSYTLDTDAERIFYRNGELIAICKDGDKYSIKIIDVKN
ncbi:MAG TPA: trypsin-like peptidase domain-containing protein, partial [Patescibacteria group bacterium]|nr:trypsin-like peptidase domain-containing protein [Patescibacteria group bacterium]